jgi:hypothetical protein
LAVTDDLATALADVQAEADGLLSALRHARILAIESKDDEHFLSRSIAGVDLVKAMVGRVQATIAIKSHQIASEPLGVKVDRQSG